MHHSEASKHIQNAYIGRLRIYDYDHTNLLVYLCPYLKTYLKKSSIGWLYLNKTIAFIQIGSFSFEVMAKVKVISFILIRI